MSKTISIKRLAGILLGGIFLASGLIKALNRAAFFEQILNYAILPPAPAVALGYYLPYLEIVAGSGLIIGTRPRECATVAMGMLVIFLGVLFSAEMRNLDIGCGCFGVADRTGLWGAILRDLALFALAFYIARRKS